MLTSKQITEITQNHSEL